MLRYNGDNGDITWEPLNGLRKDDPVTLAKYAHEKGITNERGWKWSRKINKRPKKLLRMLRINASQKGAARKNSEIQIRSTDSETSNARTRVRPPQRKHKMAGRTSARN